MMRRLGLLAVCLILVICSTSARSFGQGSASAEQTGTISGVVIDAVSGDPIIEAGVEVLGLGKKTRTDLDGKYAIKVPPGTYELRVFAPLFQGTRLQNVAVTAGATAKANAALRGEGEKAVEVVEVVAQASKAAAATQMIIRQKAEVVSDNISAEEVKASPDSDAGEIVQRIPAVVTVDDKYINVRGLNERYTTALLNSSRLPSTDPARRVVPLDLFPSDFIESIGLVKGYSPNLPGDFAGGLANIELKRAPEQFTLSMGMTSGANTNATFREFNGYHGDAVPDYFGFGNAFRSLPNSIPNQQTSVNSTEARRQAYGRSFRDIWKVENQSAPPNFGLNFSVGNAWGPFGIGLGANYTTEYKKRNNAVESQLQPVPGGSPQPLDNFTYDESAFETHLGSVLTTSYKLDNDNAFDFRALYNQNSIDDIYVGTGSERNVGSLGVTRFLYTVDQLGFGQLGGTHHFTLFDMSWRTAYAQTTEDQPDGRIQNRLDPYGDNIFTDSNYGGRRIFGSLTERMTDSGVDFTVPFTTGLPWTDLWSGHAAKLKFGPAYTYRNRSQELRQFLFFASTSGIDLSLPTEEILAAQNIGPNPNNRGVQFQEVTQPRDSFSAHQEIGGGYVMFELPILEGLRSDEDHLLRHQLRLQAGTRAEYSYIVSSYVNDMGNPGKTRLNDLDPMPAVNLTYNPQPDMNVRLGWSETVTRPEFRELSPVQYPAPGSIRALAGNPFLIETHIQSVDLRWEWFRSAAEVFSVGGFYKDLKDPIEQVLVLSGSKAIDSFANAKSAYVLGLELEGRQNLAQFWNRLEGFSILSNVTFADSDVTPNAPSATETTAQGNRTLSGQAPYVVNSALNYQHDWLGSVRLLYNTVGNRIYAVGDKFGLPNNIQKRRDQLDLVYLTKVSPFGSPLDMKVAVENVLNDNYLFTQGSVVQQRYRTGVKFSVGFSYSF